MMAEARWDKDHLYRMVREELGDYLFIIVSNREPYVHTFSGSEIVCTRPVGGLTEALDPVLRAAGGTWIAQGTGDADREAVDGNNRIPVPPEAPEYTLRRVWLTAEENAGFYLGFANRNLWPLCHVTFTPPEFSETEWMMYQRVNRIFADAVLKEAGGRHAVVLVQDYHFALLSRMLKEANPALTVGQFWHIPWPPHDIFRTCPWAEEIMEGLLGNDLFGFHTPSFCRNFRETAARTLDCRIDTARGAVSYRGKETLVEPFPISVDFDGISAAAASREVDAEMENLRREYRLEGKFVGIGIDRMDYTKGIPERLLAYEKFLGDNPDYRGKVVFFQAGMPSRTEIATYQAIGQRIDELMARINREFGTASWQPVVPLTRQLTPVTLNALRRLAHFCIVSSLHDGMNLVAKEYAAARSDGDGVLILSRFTGAADEMGEALLINPFDIAGFARSIGAAITMPEAERRRRMAALRATVSENNIYRWGGSMVSRLISLAGR